jgi:hypothetical protein
VTVIEAINAVVFNTDNTNTTDATDPRRLRHLDHLREVVDEIRYYRDWAFTRASALLTVPGATGYVELPADFLRIGNYGGVWNLDSNGDPVDHVPEYMIEEDRRTSTYHSSPMIYSIFGESATGRQYLQMPLAASDQHLGISYLTQSPTLDEGTNNTKLAVAIPAEYHRSVVLPRLRSLARESLGDVRWKNSEEQFTRGLRSMLASCRRNQGTLLQLPSFFGA